MVKITPVFLLLLDLAQRRSSQGQQAFRSKRKEKLKNPSDKEVDTEPHDDAEAEQ
jgi:hypothetical protein